MRLRTIVDSDMQVYVPAYLFSSNLGSEVFSVQLLVDTGATISTIMSGDAERLGVDFNKIPIAPYKAIGIGGLTDTYELRDVVLGLEEEGTGELHFERIEKMDVIKPEDGDEKLPFSLMGTDILRRFQFTYRMPVIEF